MGANQNQLSCHLAWVRLYHIVTKNHTMTSFRLTYAHAVLLTLVLTWVLIVVGAATRVYDAGMSCPDWPQCYGLWWPWPESRVINAGHLAGYMVNGQHYTGWQVALEWGHRLLAACVGGAMLGLLIGAWWQPKRVWIPLIVASCILAVQIKLGAVTVWMSNLHWSVVLHLGNAMLFAGALFWLWWRARVAPSTQPIRVPKRMWVLAVAMPICVWVTMLIGGAVSSTHSGGVCGGLFSCDGAWMPSPKVDVGQHIHMQHRLFALITFVLSIVLMVVAKRHAPHARSAAMQVHGLVLGQVVLGILTLYSFSSFPDWYYPLSIMHLGWGTLLWLAALNVGLEMRSYSATPAAAPRRKGQKS
jgi:cytochrome c oxidase assembly protein subunit 15